MEKVCLLVLLAGSAISVENSACTPSLQNLLSTLTPHYNQTVNSLGLRGVRRQDMVDICGTHNFSVELWRAIQSPSTNAPEDFGTREYFSKFQNCDSPNPDLLWKHGDSIRISIEEEGDDTAEENLIMFYHVVEKQYMLRICPCRDQTLPCTCDHAHQSVAVCSEILNITNAVEDQVFPWCRGDVSSSPTPLIGVPVLHYCPSKVTLGYLFYTTVHLR